MTETPHPLEAVFHPRTVAVVGASARSPRQGVGAYVPALVAMGFHEAHGLYPVNRAAEPTDGLEAYASLLDCPDPIDHVISQVPSQAALELAEQCVARGVRSVQFYTAGFGETGDEALATLERDVVGRLRAAGIRVFGPNCLGLYVPEERLTFMPGFPAEPGNVFLLSQSGSNAAGIIRGLAPRGVRFSKVVSFGNGSDVNAAELLDYALADPNTEVVAGYLEGTADGRGFFEALRRCARSKPVILLKAGVHPDGARAAGSHTGALAGSDEVFAAACRQAGALRARTMDELHDLLVGATTGLARIAGPRVAMAGGPGGFAVLSADAIAEAGLRVPELSTEAQRALLDFIPLAGASVRNPIDAALNDEAWRRAYRILADASSVDVLFGTSLGVGAAGDGASGKRAFEAAAALGALQRESGVPFAGIQRGALALGNGDGGFAQESHREGVAVFASVERAARTAAHLLEWRRRREGLPELFPPRA